MKLAAQQPFVPVLEHTRICQTSVRSGQRLPILLSKPARLARKERCHVVNARFFKYQIDRSILVSNNHGKQPFVSWSKLRVAIVHAR